MHHRRGTVDESRNPVLDNDADSLDKSRTGRPLRKTAGRRTLDPNYVNSTDNIKDHIGDLIEESRGAKLSAKQKKLNLSLGILSRKRARSPSPTPPPLSPIGFPTDGELQAQEEPIDPFVTRASELAPLNITFNIPFGFHGPLQLNIDPATLMRLSTPDSSRQASPLPFQAAKRQRCGLASSSEDGSGTKSSAVVERFIQKHGQPRGFCDLPPEIRNEVYRIVFVSQEDVEFAPKPQNVQRSANFLRTCRMVHTEGSSMLYGRNRFVICRTKHSRNPFWSGANKEVGYGDFRHFLAMIGPQNRAYLQDIHLVLDDASKIHVQLMKSETNGRYVYDPNLLVCLKVVARDCYLRRLGLTFLGKKALDLTDIRFLEKLCNIEVDELHINPDRAWAGDKINYRVQETLKHEMIRPEPLYTGMDKSVKARFVQHTARWA